MGALGTHVPAVGAPVDGIRMLVAVVGCVVREQPCRYPGLGGDARCAASAYAPRVAHGADHERGEREEGECVQGDEVQGETDGRMVRCEIVGGEDEGVGGVREEEEEDGDWGVLEGAEAGWDGRTEKGKEGVPGLAEGKWVGGRERERDGTRGELEKGH